MVNESEYKFLGDRLEAQAETLAKVVSERNQLRDERERLREALRDLLSAAVETVEENKPTVRLRLMIAEANKTLFLNGVNVLNEQKGE